MVDNATAAVIWQPQTKVNVWSLFASDETSSTPIHHKLILSRPARTKYGPALKTQNSLAGILERKCVLPQDWKLLVNLSLVGAIKVKDKITELLSKHIDLQNGRVETFKATNHTIGLKNERRPVRQHLYWAR